MKVFYIFLTLAVLFWKAILVWQRGVNTYRRDRHDHHSLYEYLLGNGATEAEALNPFLTHALVRAFRPLLTQWRLLLALIAFALLIGLIADTVSIPLALLLLVIMLLVVGVGTLIAIYIYTRIKR